MKYFGIIGYPLSHSFSKKYFSEKILLQGITNTLFEEYPLPLIDKLIPLLKQNSNIEGLCITIPHKQAVLQYLTDWQHLPIGLNACNCIKIVGDQLIGFNTDVIGFERSLLPLLQTHHTQALILGNGGAAAAVKFVLNRMGITFKIVSRTIHDGSDLVYAELDEAIIKAYPLIINTTPLGTFPAINDCPAIPYQFLTANHLLFDLVYNPSKTVFLQKGAEQGAKIKNGYEMLVIQAEANWAIWNGFRD